MKIAAILKFIKNYKDTFFSLFLFLTTSIVYSRMTGNDFVVMDDPLQLTNNKHVLSGITWENIQWAFSPDSNCSPLTWFIYTIGHSLFGLNPCAFHISMLIIHVTSSILLFYLFKRMTGEFWKSAFVGTLFALHPINVESVAWVAEMNNVLSGLFFMLTLSAYSFYTRHPDWKKFVLALLVFEFGLLAKPVLITLPFILLLLDFWPLRRFQLEKIPDTQSMKISGIPFLRLILEKIPFLILSFISLASNLVSANKRMGLFSDETIPFSLRFSNALVSTVKYLMKLIYPHDLTLLYPYPQSIPLWQVAGAVIILGFLTILALRTLYRYPYFIVGWLWFLGGLVPFLGFFQAGVWPEMADRYAYLTYIGIFISLSWGIPDLFGGWKHYRIFAALTGSVTIIFLMALTFIQLGFWKDSVILFRHVIEVIHDRPGSFNNTTLAIAHNNLGLALFNEHDIEGATKEYRESININPKLFYPYYNLGMLLAEERSYDDAANQFRHCLKLNPKKENAYNGLGNIMLAKGRYDEAIDCYIKELQIEPHQPGVCFNLGIAYFRKGNNKKAIEFYKAALREKPDYTEVINELQKAKAAQRNLDILTARTQEMIRIEPGNSALLTTLGDIYRRQDELDQAITQYQKAISNQADAIKAIYGLAIIYSDRHEYEKAINQLFRIKQIQPDNPEAYYNIACIYAKQNMTNESINWLKQAVDKGFHNWDLIKNDPDLENIRTTSFVNSLMKNN